ncbi:extracellular serine protease [Fusarium phyllophilum]|uniref:Extracellular serine protease n=1 Tax=Fusarium phyllophilum TaxID=47803 RepID=A0A8H5IIT9_9HYPO|nr:extracellular serine protease [Fusarium phyllophilum]
MSDFVSFHLRWRLLKASHRVFNAADTFPSADDVRFGCFGALPGHDKPEFERVIENLRALFEYSIPRQDSLDIGIFSSHIPEWESFATSLGALLSELEDLVHEDICDVQRIKLTMGPESLSTLSGFPKLVALWEALKYREMPPVGDNLPNDNANNISNPTIPEKPTSAKSAMSPRYSDKSVKDLSQYIRFPRDPKLIEKLHMSTSNFQCALTRLLEGSISDWELETPADDITLEDIDVIQHAHVFSSTCTSLFAKMADNPTCEAPHTAKLHMSGFKQDRLVMNIKTCQETDPISTVFTRSFDRPSSSKVFHSRQLCSTASSDGATSDVLHVAFDSERMWVDDAGGRGELSSIFEHEESLHQHLTKEKGLKAKYRKLASVLLAASVFQLSNSPWIEQHLELEHIFLPSSVNKGLEQWCPRIHCNLESKQDRRLQSDNIAALGVLVMELEAGRKASWTPGEKDEASRGGSNISRLTRILKDPDWLEDVDDPYRQIAKTCLEFNSLVENLDQPRISADRKGLAIIYKKILVPLFDRLVDSFKGSADLFDDMLGSGRPLAPPVSKPLAVEEKVILFDDEDATPNKQEQEKSKEFLKELDPLVAYIKAIRSEKRQIVREQHPRIRIAVLDSGVSEDITLISGAMKANCINSSKSKSFVDAEDSWKQDSHGHGSQMVQLLLRTAPTAEIYVGKICTGKEVEAGCMNRIAEAIDWAVDECDVHIISMSFAYEQDNAMIDAALAKAINRDKLIFAAVSNRGGLQGRARPARRDGVICIHATDALGNKGRMNPSPLDRADNFATFGVAVPLRWEGTDIYKSGTSYAVPIAVGFAVMAIEFATHKCRKISPHKQKALYQKRGIEALFRKMAERRDGYDFIFPTRLWEEWGSTVTDAQTARTIEETLGYL